MKKILICIMILVISLNVLMPYKASAKTVKQFEEEVNKYTKELEAKKANLAKNDKEVKEIKNKIAAIETEIDNAKKEVAQLEIQIKENQEKIKKKVEESKSIVAYYQMANGTNFYLEYAFGAETITDMIYRLSVVEQLTEYNEQVMNELEVLIKEEQAKQEELTKKQEELAKKQKDLQAQKARIDADSKGIIESMPSIETRIKSAKESLNFYKKLGCGTNEDIQACEYRISQASGSSIPSVGTFSRPIENGYIVRGMTGGHRGYDFSSNNKSIAIYSIAAGVVHKMYEDSCNNKWCKYGCHGNAKIVVVKYNYGGRYIYVSYVHLGSYANIREGQTVFSGTILGYMGTSGCSTGPHLHIEAANCFWKNGGCTWEQYQDRLINVNTLFSIPSRWNNR